MNEQIFKRIVRGAAIYDLAVTALFATPFTFPIAYAILNRAQTVLGLGNLPEFLPAHILFANLLGFIVIAWAWIRLLHPIRDYCVADIVVRFPLCFWQVYCVLIAGQTKLLWGFAFFEVFWCATQLFALLRTRCRPSPAPKASESI